MKKTTKTLLMGTALAGLGVLSACESIPKLYKDNIAKICSEYCRDKPKTKENTGFFTMVKRVKINGEFEKTPMRQIYVKTNDNKLMTPYNPPYGNQLGQGDRDYPDKSVNLRLECFSTEAYEPIDLSDKDSDNYYDIDLNLENTTIIVLNFTEDGRLESRELDTTSEFLSNIHTILTTTGTNEYETLRIDLSNMDVPTTDDLYASSPKYPAKNLIQKNVPEFKTPFFSDLNDPSYTASEGHVYFYVTADPYLKFSREYAALITYAPEAEDDSMKLYTPFVQYDVYPAEYDERQLDVLPFHFYQNPNAEIEDTTAETCSYIYDLHVISYGQSTSGNTTSPFIEPHSTPLFIDPEVKTRGVILD